MILWGLHQICRAPTPNRWEISRTLSPQNQCESNESKSRCATCARSSSRASHTNPFTRFRGDVGVRRITINHPVYSFASSSAAVECS